MLVALLSFSPFIDSSGDLVCDFSGHVSAKADILGTIVLARLCNEFP